MNAALSALEQDAARVSAVTLSNPQAADAARWNAYVDRHPEGTFFHLFGWREVLERAVGFRAHYLMAQRGETIVGLLPLVRVKSLLFGDALVSLPFCVQGGVIADDAAAERALLAEASGLAERLGVDYLELRHTRALAADWLTKSETYVLFRRELSAEVEDNMKAIPRKQRAMVRKGIAAGLVSREETTLDRFFPIYATSVRNLGTPVFPRHYFEALYRVFAAHCRVTTVFHGAEAVSAVLSFVYKDTIMPYYGGGIPAARDLKAYDFLYWEVMRRACEQGIRHFDYGRSKRDSGSYAFKKNWGFEPEPLHYQYHLVKHQALPNRNPNNPKYALAVNTWKKLPLPLANFLGPLVSPYLA
ncbi:MAG TPA: FemAB family PEP-CTERM system-associated protein [Gammaproteobacteria bacterium]|nr:FemAB family PEP-CTERM system-associated protein [Gammaproteobacteria bacterium]